MPAVSEAQRRMKPTVRFRDNPQEYLRQWRKLNESYVRNKEYKKRFGISLADYDAMLAAQGGVCAICGKKQGRRRLNVDHCHKTGRVRGLLCDVCNLVIGQLEDAPEVLRRAAEYLGVRDAGEE